MDIVIVFYLHYLVALAEKSKARIQLVFIIRRRIHKRLEYFVEIYRAGLALFDGQSTCISLSGEYEYARGSLSA